MSTRSRHLVHQALDDALFTAGKFLDDMSRVEMLEAAAQWGRDQDEEASRMSDEMHLVDEESEEAVA